jgi:hypothetical protein
MNLTPRNALVLDQYADLFGRNWETFLNAYLEAFLGNVRNRRLGCPP